MKNFLKITLCIILTFVLMFGAGASTYLVVERCAIYDDFVYYKRNEGVNIFRDMGMTISEYYCDVPTDFDPIATAEKMELSTDPDILIKAMGYDTQWKDRVVLSATFLGAKHGFEVRTQFEFQIDKIYSYEGKFDPVEGDTITLKASAERLHYYTQTEFLLNYYGVNFEQGEQYLLFLSKTNRGHDISFLSNTLAVCKLSGEYPSIIMLPGPAEYDATYFGASTKYVSNNEFLNLLTLRAQELVVK